MTSDWLSPILVKELRQGMRSKAFEGVFILLQVLMVLTMLAIIISAEESGSHGMTSVATGSFWSMVAIPVLFIMPLRGCGALVNEVDAKTLELMFLTRLSAWRIVFGKWAALFAQTCLLVCAILPYVVMRYFVGGIEIASELLGVCIMLLTSGLLLAITVALSSFKSRFVRCVSYAVPFALVWWGMVFGMVLTSTGGRTIFTGSMGRSLTIYSLFALTVVLYCFELGASRIGPIAENHETRKRLLGLAVLLTGPLLVFFGLNNHVHIVCFYLVLPVCLDALCRPWRNLPIHYTPFLKLTRFNRIAAWCLLPGWPSGVVYTVLVFTISTLLFVFSGLMDDGLIMIVAICFCTLLLPLALLGNGVLRTDHLGGTYLGVQMGALFLGMIAASLLGLFGALDHRYSHLLANKTGWMAFFLIASGLIFLAVILRRSTFWLEMRHMPGRAQLLQDQVQDKEEPR